ncbi:hypothetical protein ACH4PR_51710 [Streptomyces mirabilis]|uniref:hypothetical protein n=1 Tax=Streptomyces mirabilis TaxID=68239 RepID=UPI00379A4851
MSDKAAGIVPDWDQRLSAALRRLVFRLGLYVSVAMIWSLSGFVDMALPGVLYQPWHLLVEQPPADAGSLGADHDLTDAEKQQILFLTGSPVIQGKIRVWARADGNPSYYATMLEFPTGYDAERALRNAATGRGGLREALFLSQPGDFLNSRGVHPGQRIPGLSMTLDGDGPYYVQRSGYVFLLEAASDGPGQQAALRRWKRQQEDLVSFSPDLAHVLPGQVHTPAAVSGWIAVIIALYAAVSILTAPLRYGIARLKQARSVPTVPRAAVPPPEQPAHTINAEARVRRRRVRATSGAAVRCAGYLLVLLAALRWWWLVGPLPLAPFALIGAVVLVHLSDRVAGSKGRQVSYPRMVKAATARERAAAGLWFLLALVNFLFALTWYPEVNSSLTSISDSEASAQGFIVSAGWAGLVLLPVSTWALRRGRRRVELTAGQVTQDDLRPPVLYLRSFADDKLIVRSHASSRQGVLARYTYRRWELFEEVVAWHLWRYGPVVAAAEPGAEQPALGAAREELDDSVDAVWRARVTALAEQAGLIVVLVGRTEGLAWELELLHRLGRLDRTVFLLPPVPRRSKTGRWETTRQIFGSLGERLPRLPQGSGEIIAASISSDGVVFATARRHSDWSYEAALEALLEDIRNPRLPIDAGGHG